MNLTERMKKNDVFLDIKKRFEAKYPVKTFGKNECFIASNGVIFRPFEFPGEDALGIEYAETAEEAKKNRFEDGDLFYLSELSGDALFDALVAEIES